MKIIKQEVQAIADLKAGYTLGHADVAILNELARIALASLEAKSRKLFTCSGCGAEGLDEPLESKCHCNEDGAHWVESVVYTAPPAPVSVPEPIKRNDADGWWMYKGRRVGGCCAEWYNRALDDCRAAMLHGADGNSPVIPDEVLSAIRKVARIRADFDDFDGDRRGIGDCLDEAEQELIVTINKHASVIAAAPQQEVNK